jgi:hypothetical protein
MSFFKNKNSEFQIQTATKVNKPISKIYTKIETVSGLRNIGLETLGLREISYQLLLLLLLLYNIILMLLITNRVIMKYISFCFTCKKLLEVTF